VLQFPKEVAMTVQAEVAPPPATVPQTTETEVAPSIAAIVIAPVCVAASLVLAAFAHPGDGFTPRIDTLDALAGLAIGAFVVDRLLTFVPPFGAAKEPKRRAADLGLLRVGYGAVLGAAFVMLTDLRAVEALTAEGSKTIGAGVDRAIAVLAIAGGVTGLARLLSGINPQPETDASKAPEKVLADTSDTIPPPSPSARIAGVIAVAVGAAIALVAIGDKNGVDMVKPDQLADGTVGLIVRFGLVFLAAAIVEQAVEFLSHVRPIPKNEKPVIVGGLAVIAGVLAARLFDLYLLHNIGFFGTAPGIPLNDALSASTGLERWGDTFVTGLVIAAGTKPIHDLAARLRKSETKQAEPATS
jgi:hypothetical protein